MGEGRRNEEQSVCREADIRGHRFALGLERKWSVHVGGRVVGYDLVGVFGRLQFFLYYLKCAK